MDAWYLIVGFQMMASEHSLRTVTGDSGSQRFAGSPTSRTVGSFLSANCPKDGRRRSPEMALEISGLSTKLTVSIVCVAGLVVEQIPWATLGRGTPATALLPDPLQGGVWLGFHGNVAYLKDGEIRDIVRGRRRFGRRPCQQPPVRRERCALGRNGERTQPCQRWACRHIEQQERTALRRRALEYGRRRPFGLAVHGLRTGTRCLGRS